MQMKFALVSLAIATVSANVGFPGDTTLLQNAGYSCNVLYTTTKDKSSSVELTVKQVIEFADQFGVRNHHPDKRYGSYHTDTSKLPESAWQKYVRMEYEFVEPVWGNKKYPNKKYVPAYISITKFTGLFDVCQHPHSF